MSTADLRFKVSLLVGVVVLFSFSILYTNYVNRQSDQRWCDLMVSLDERYQDLKTQDPSAIRLREQIRTLRSDLHCSEPPYPTAPPAVTGSQSPTP